MIQNYLFDMDGTLNDSKEGVIKCILYALAKMHVDYQGSLDWCLGPPLEDSFSKILKTTDPVKIKEAMKFYRVRYFVSGQNENSLYPGILDLLKKLAGNKN